MIDGADPLASMTMTMARQGFLPGDVGEQIAYFPYRFRAVNVNEQGQRGGTRYRRA